MASSTQIYLVSILNSGSGAAPADGFVDNKRIEDYGLDLASSGLTFDLCKAKRRGNIRYQYIIFQIEMVSNVYIPLQSIISDATATTEATNFSFQIWVEHGDSSLVTADELNPGQFLTSTACIIRCVARALSADLFREVDVFDPTATTSTGTWGSTVSIPRYGVTIIPAADFEIAPYATSLSAAESSVTVTMM